MEEINIKQSRLLELKAYLNETDYMIIKMSEGYEVKQDVLNARAQARVEINRLEAEIEELEQQEEEIDILRPKVEAL